MLVGCRGVGYCSLLGWLLIASVVILHLPLRELPNLAITMEVEGEHGGDTKFAKDVPRHVTVMDT